MLGRSSSGQTTAMSLQLFLAPITSLQELRNDLLWLLLLFFKEVSLHLYLLHGLPGVLNDISLTLQDAPLFFHELKLLHLNLNLCLLLKLMLLLLKFIDCLACVIHVMGFLPILVIKQLGYIIHKLTVLIAKRIQLL